VLNGDETITVQDQTRQRIYQASKELGYKTIQERRNQQQTVISKKNPAMKAVKQNDNRLRGWNLSRNNMMSSF
jgi:DNA-binding LacI/PurR family transcriptional regulator